ncbi:sulfur carrier protein ThiS [Thalassobacillus sp. CUG 92003]|uniref:sulfur carrier protein ThiS n=1 Tax=Thalassobacillus sp. CUG 92003 TaxID=2736641 RepID=UPI0015E65C13|nr:sulfur carrier protein ThiS [Thalassobacillus sp. CUG 92003]
MTLHVNGEMSAYPEEVATISDLLQYHELNGQMVIVEYNQTIVDRTAYATTRLCSGDQLELVHFVGGG